MSNSALELQPLRLAPSTRTVETGQPIFGSSRQFARGDFDQRIYRFIAPSGPFDFRDRVQNRRVMQGVVEVSNLREAPACRMLREIHRQLPAEARTVSDASTPLVGLSSAGNSLPGRTSP